MLNKRKVLLRADAGSQTGYGHFVRTLALASYLHSDFDCKFYTFNHDEGVPTLYQLEEINKVCEYVEIRGRNIGEYNQLFLDELKGDEIVVLDNYYFCKDFQERIKEIGCKLVCIDDLHNRHFVADGLITICPIERKEFSLEDYTKFLGGIKYSFLRPEFINYKSNNSRDPEIKNIVVGMGGADPFGLTNKFLHLLNSIRGDWKINAIAGDTVEVDKEKYHNVEVFRRLSAKEIVELFDKADVGIFPSSTISIEALACGLPIIAGWFVDNQKELYEYGVSNGYYLPLGYLLDSSDVLKIRLADALKKVEAKDQPIIDFKGGREEIVELFKKL